MECQTLPSTSSLSNASTELAPRRRTTVLPKARVFILPKKTRGSGAGAGSGSASGRLASADNLLLAAPPSSPMTNDTPPVSGVGRLGPPKAPRLPSIPHDLDQVDVDVEDYEAMEVDLPPPPPSPLPVELRGPVKLLPRMELEESALLHDFPLPPRMSSASTVPPHSRRPRASAREESSRALVLREREHDRKPNSGLRQLGVRVAIGGQSPPISDALVSLAQAHAAGVVSRTISGVARGGAACAYDEFVSTPKPSLWKRFTRRFRASLAPGSGNQPRPAFTHTHTAHTHTVNPRA